MVPPLPLPPPSTFGTKVHRDRRGLLWLSWGILSWSPWQRAGFTIRETGMGTAPPCPLAVTLEEAEGFLRALSYLSLHHTHHPGQEGDCWRCMCVPTQKNQPHPLPSQEEKPGEAGSEEELLSPWGPGVPAAGAVGGGAERQPGQWGGWLH